MGSDSTGMTQACACYADTTAVAQNFRKLSEAELADQAYGICVRHIS
jgi:hypothetical protein